MRAPEPTRTLAEIIRIDTECKATGKSKVMHAQSGDSLKAAMATVPVIEPKP